MDPDPDEPVDLCVVPSSFEADTIAACLKDRGFRAYAITIAATVVQWQGGLANLSRVQVPRGELADARAVLAAVKEQAKSIDWNQELEKHKRNSAPKREQEDDASGQEFAAGSMSAVPALAGSPGDDDKQEAAHLPLQNIVWFGIFILVVVATAGIIVVTVLVLTQK